MIHFFVNVSYMYIISNIFSNLDMKQHTFCSFETAVILSIFSNPFVIWREKGLVFLLLAIS